MKDRAHDDAMAEAFRKDPAYAVELLNSILEYGDQGELVIALRQMTKTVGGASKVAEQAHLNGTHIYRTLSAKGNPELRSLSAIIKTMGLRLAVQPICRIPDDCIDSKRYPLFIAREAMRALVYDLTQAQGEST